jgi:hypothetical protein
MCTQENGNTFCTWERLRYLAGCCTMVRVHPPFTVTFLRLVCRFCPMRVARTDMTAYSPVPFLIMGRVTYIHHYVRLSLSPFFFSSFSNLRHVTLSLSPTSPALSFLQRQTRTSSRRSTLPSSWEGICSTTLSSRPGASLSVQNQSSLPSSRSPLSPTFGGSAASRGASTARSTTIGDSGGERSVLFFFFLFLGGPNDFPHQSWNIYDS